MPYKGTRKRLTKRKAKQSSAPSKPFPSRPYSTRLQWTDAQMTAAIKAVKSGGGVNQAARDHGVPKTTLKDRLCGRVEHGTKPGPKPYLSSTEEKELGTFLKECAGVGYGKTRKDVMLIAESVAREKGLKKISYNPWMVESVSSAPR